MPISSWSNVVTLPNGAGNDVQGIQFAGGVYCGVYAEPYLATQYVFYSATGLDGSWSSVNYGVGGLGKKIVHDGTKFVVTAGDSTSVSVFTGATLATLVAATNLPVISSNKIHDAVVIGSRIVVISDKAAFTSDDHGDTWATHIYTAGDWHTGATWKTAATNGTVIVTVNYSTSQAQVSADNGETWSLVSLPTLSGLRRMCWNGSVFCAVSETSITCLTSPNGTDWTVRTPNNRRVSIAANSTGDLVSAGSTGLYGADDYGIDISTDNGQTWQSVGPMGFQAGGPFGETNIRCIASDGTNFCVTANNASQVITSIAASDFWTNLVNCTQT